MTYRIHTARANGVEVEAETGSTIDRLLGWEHTAEDADQQFILLIDHGNQEAWVFTGTPEDVLSLGIDLIRTAQRAMAAEPGVVYETVANPTQED